MPTPAPPLNVGFGTPWQEQIDFLRQKLRLPTEKWDDIQRAAHDRAFMVAGAAKADLLMDLHGLVTQAAGQGIGQAQFLRQFKELVARHGWTGWTGEGSAAGQAWRARVIYQTNLAHSYAAGRWQQLKDPEFLHLRPYWRYIHSETVRHPRPQHLAWHGLTLPHDHPFFLTHFAPNGWGCRCRIVAVSKREGEASTKAGLGQPPKGWNAIDPKTGAMVGIDKGFDYAPGAGVKQSFQRLIDDKLIRLDAPIGAAMWEVLGPVLLQERAAAYRQWLAALATDVMAKSQTPIIGAISAADLKWLADNNKPQPGSAEIAISSAPINGPKAQRHATKGDAIPASVWENLPEMLAEPLAVLYDTAKETLLYVLPEAGTRRVQVVVEFDFSRKDRLNMVISGYRPMLGDLLARVKNGALQTIRGALDAENQ